MLAAAKFKPADVVKALSLFSTHVARVGYGQYLDISVTGEDDRTIKEIRTVMQLKTSDYTTSLPLLVGASLAGCRKQETIKAIRQYASHLGMIFQIKDDLLGIFGNQEKTGKPVGTDLRERKQTLIIEHLKSHGNIHQLGVLSRLFGKKEISEEDLTDFKQVLEEVDTQAYLNRLAMKHLRLAKQQISTITKSSRIGQIFESFLFFALERNV
jgi:geranylgeranyl diphosphate synthase type I